MFGETLVVILTVELLINIVSTMIVKCLAVSLAVCSLLNCRLRHVIRSLVIIWSCF